MLYSPRMSEFTPTLWVDERNGRVRICLDGVASAEGPTLQEAADELVWKVLVAVMEFRERGPGALAAAGRPCMELVALLWELAEIASDGGDIRERLLGPPDSLAA